MKYRILGKKIHRQEKLKRLRSPLYRTYSFFHGSGWRAHVANIMNYKIIIEEFGMRKRDHFALRDLSYEKHLEDVSCTFVEIETIENIDDPAFDNYEDSEGVRREVVSKTYNSTLECMDIIINKTVETTETPLLPGDELKLATTKEAIVYAGKIHSLEDDIKEAIKQEMDKWSNLSWFKRFSTPKPDIVALTKDKFKQHAEFIEWR